MSAGAVTERTVDLGEVSLHIHEAGEGPLVLLCHGFPELGYSWRNQMLPLAEAGYHVVAPDQRGYGRSSRPEPVEDYDILHLTGDALALIDALGHERAVVVGHDWGANVVWSLALRAPERLAGVVGMSVPFIPRPAFPPTQAMKHLFGDTFFYMLYFQEYGVADADLGRDAPRMMRKMLAGASYGAETDGSTAMFEPKGEKGFVDRLPEPITLPPWLTDEVLAHYGEEFSRTGFTGGLNWYRNLDRNWELTADWAERKVEIPALFVAGANDVVLMMTPPSVMDGWVTDLRGTIMVPEAGHWVQQEQPAAVNGALLDFLGSLEHPW